MTQTETEALLRLTQSAEYPVLKNFLQELAHSTTQTSNIKTDTSPEMIAAEVVGRNLVSDILATALASLDMLKKQSETKTSKMDKYE